MLDSLLSALSFAADRHSSQRRKDSAQSPYINHVIEVAAILARNVVTVRTALLAAILHDTIEDTDTTADELAERFGPEVRDVVLEVTDDKSLPKKVRKQLQIEHAATLSHAARLVKLGDKISNIRYVAHHPPLDWSLERRREYLDWTEAVVNGLRGADARLEARYDAALAEARAELGVVG